MRKMSIIHRIYFDALSCIFTFLLLGLFGLSSGEIFSGSAPIKPSSTKGMVIDAGSGGSRLHIYSWKPRIFNTVPPPLSVPESNEKWTGLIHPGIASYADNPDLVSEHLAPLIDFARVSLTGLEKEFADYPIYFKATGGMRELELTKREEIMKRARKYLSDKSFCPFYFRDDFARVISGEEEAIFSWAATNFVKGTLLPNSEGTGMVTNVSMTYGTLDLGGASTQIAFYVPSQDINEGLFSLQIGGQKHWNVYTKSFLQFGVVSARVRHMTDLADTYFQVNGNGTKNQAPTGVNYCFHSGYSEPTFDSTGKRQLNLKGPDKPDADQLHKCMDSVRELMEKKYGTFCKKVYHGDCSIAGAYQPPLPTGPHGHFMGQSSYKYPWKFLMMPETSTLELFEARAAPICRMSFAEVMVYYETNGLNSDKDKLGDFLAYYCFLSSYVLVLLRDGYGFHRNQTLTVVDEINGNKVGWALGSILYEINELPWDLEMTGISAHPLGYAVAAAVIGFMLGSAAAVCIYRELVDLRSRSRHREEEADEDDIQRVTTVDLMEMLRKDKGLSLKMVESPDTPDSPSSLKVRKSINSAGSGSSPVKALRPPEHHRRARGSSSGSGSGSEGNARSPQGWISSVMERFSSGKSNAYERIPES